MKKSKTTEGGSIKRVLGRPIARKSEKAPFWARPMARALSRALAKFRKVTRVTYKPVITRQMPVTSYGKRKEAARQEAAKAKARRNGPTMADVASKTLEKIPTSGRKRR